MLSGNARAASAVWYVDIDAPAGGDGGGWATALRHPQDAVDAASSGDEVWVAEGTYTDADSDNVVLTMRDGVAIYGGFAGTEALRDERDWAAHVTMLDGENACYHVVSGASNATLDGFIVSRGNARGGYPENCGAGMYNDGVTGLAVVNCTLSDNSATYSGGGMYNAGSSPTVTDCRFSGNTADNWGGGMRNGSSSPVVTGCTFFANMAPLGGGVYNESSSPAFANCVFSGNSADYGGGMENYNNSSPTVNSCTFAGNDANYGGGMRNWDSSPDVTNSILWGNSASAGAGIHNIGSSCTVLYSDVQGGYGGAGNIDADPLFADPGAGNLRLGPGSPCIDAADGTAAPATDIEGNPRHDDSGTPNTGVGPPWADMGAHEFQEASPADPDADGDGLPDSWEVEHFGSTDFCDPGDDPDADGLTNLEEYQLGTDPLSATALVSAAPASLTFFAAAESGVLTESFTVENVGPDGWTAEVVLDASSLPGHILVTPEGFSLHPGGSRAVYVQMDPSGLSPGESFAPRKVGDILATAAGSGVPVRVDVLVGVEGDGGAQCGAGALPCVLMLLSALGRRRRSSFRRLAVAPRPFRC